MSNFKAGDRFKVISDHLSFVDVNIGDIVVLSKIEGDNCHLFYHQKTKSHVALFFHHVEIIDGSEYESSNRYKLKQAIKETGISSRKLSHFAMGNESFFYNQTGPARFKEYGDISSSKLDSMLVLLEVAKINLNAKITQDAFNEREKLDLAAKTADENNVPVIDKPIFNLDCGSSDIEDYQRLVKSKAIEKRDYRLRNFMIVFLILVIILAVYFFTR